MERGKMRGEWKRSKSSRVEGRGGPEQREGGPFLETLETEFDPDGSQWPSTFSTESPF